MVANNVSANARSLADSLRGLTATVQAALSSYDQAPQPELDVAAKKWRNTALRLLLADLQKLEAVLAVPESPAGVQTCMQISTNEVGLAKNLDSFRFDFAGPTFAKQLSDAVDAVVYAASLLNGSIASLRSS